MHVICHLPQLICCCLCIMKWLLKASMLLACYCVVPGSCSGGYSISCSSEFTPQTGNFCVGIPLQCTLQLNNVNCSSNGSEAVMLSRSDLSLQVLESDVGNTAPDFILNQTGFLLNVIMAYYPLSSLSTVKVQISSSNADCDFAVDSSDLAVSSPVECQSPLSFNLASTDPSYPDELEGGNIVSLVLELTANSHMIENLAVTIGNIHPGLLLLSNTSATVTDPMIGIQSYVADIHGLSVGSFEPLLLISDLPPSEMLSVNLSFQVQPFVQPKAALYFSLHAFYHHSSYGNFTFKVSTPQLREFVVASPSVTIRDFTLSLPYYNDTDHVQNTFPPHEGDMFSISISLYLPCVSTNLSAEVSIPEFWSEHYTLFFTNVTDVNSDIPFSVLSLQSLCNYTDPFSFDPDACYMESMINSNSPQPVLVFAEKAGAGVDTVTIDFGLVWRNITIGEDCAGETPDPNCSCDKERITITLTGVVLTDVLCENQTLADNVTLDLSYTSDINTWIDDNFELSNEVPKITKNDSTNSIHFMVNASLPAISLSISSHSGDAGDAFNVTFGVNHNSAYSSFTAYNVNYTFSIDPHLDPDENITICLYNTSDVPVSCEDVPFINYTIIRYGYHEV